MMAANGAKGGKANVTSAMKAMKAAKGAKGKAMKAMKAAKGAKAKEKVEWMKWMVPEGTRLLNYQMKNGEMPKAWLYKAGLFYKPIRKRHGTHCMGFGRKIQQATRLAKLRKVPRVRSEGSEHFQGSTNP